MHRERLASPSSAANVTKAGTRWRLALDCVLRQQFSKARDLSDEVATDSATESGVLRNTSIGSVSRRRTNASFAFYPRARQPPISISKPKDALSCWHHLCAPAQFGPKKESGRPCPGQTVRPPKSRRWKKECASWRASSSRLRESPNLPQSRNLDLRYHPHVDGPLTDLRTA